MTSGDGSSESAGAVGGGSARDVLLHAGASKGAVPEIIRAAIALCVRAASHPAPTEYAAMFDLRTGGVVGTVSVGVGREVDVTEQFRVLRPDRPYLAFHTHPGGTPFSLLDVKTFLEHPMVTAIAVLTRDGRWNVKARQRMTPPGDLTNALTRIAQTFAQLRPHYQAQAARGALTGETALAALLHQLWCEVAGPIGLRYDWSDK